MNDNIYKCSNNDIDIIVKDIKYYSQFYTSKDINNLINYVIKTKINEIIENYNINDCITIILNNGDIYDAINNNENTCFDMTNKIKFHQELARPYLKDWISKKINEIIFIDLLKKYNDEKICSICLDHIQPILLSLTRCNHSFHKNCILHWINNTCPICRNTI